MATYRQVKTLTPVEAAYIAGLVDGEGTISLARKHRLENRGNSLSVLVAQRLDC